MENKINPIAAMKSGWTLTKEHLIVSLGLLLVYTIVSSIMGAFPAEGIWGVGSWLLSIAVSCAWTAGMARITICAVDGEEPQFSMFGDAMPRFAPMMLMTLIMIALAFIPIILIIIMAIVVGYNIDNIWQLTSSDPNDAIEAMLAMIPLLFFIMIPCIYLCIRFILAPYILVDRGLGAIDSLKMSWTATAPIQGKVFVFILLVCLANIIGVACFLVGAFVSTITTLYAQAALYRQVFPAGIQDPLLVEDTNVVMN